MLDSDVPSTTLLLVEDNPGDVILLEEHLKEANFGSHRLFKANTIEQAIGHLNAERFDVVLLDLSLPDSQGIETVRRVVGVASDVPIVVMTDLDNDQIVQEVLRNGAQDYLIKAEVTARLLARTIRHATERHRLNLKLARHARELYASEVRFRRLIEDSNDGIVILNAKGRISYINKAAMVLLKSNGRRPELGQPFGRPVTIGQEEEFEIQDGDESRLIEMRVTATDWEGIHSSLITLRDQTDRKRASDERKQFEAQLQHSQRFESLGRLAGGIAHDFNNMVTIITGNSRLLQDKFSPEDPRHGTLAEVLKAAERSAGLTRQLLAFSRKQFMNPRVLCLNTQIGDLKDLLQRLIGEDIILSARLDKNISNIKADPVQIEQVIVNLSVNARDAMPSGGRLSIETANVELDEGYVSRHVGVAGGEYVRLTISDSGTGMDEETKARIFEPFFSTKGPGKGSGLGLATVYGIIKQSGGNIWVYSEVGKGTVFKIYLPAVEQKASPRVRKSKTEPVRKGTETILLVEDEPALLEMVKTVLELQGYTVLQALNGPAALALSEKHGKAIELLVTDLVMPEMSGRELAERISASSPGTKVLFMSGYTDDVAIQAGDLQPGSEFIEKPFTPEGLAGKVRKILDAKMALQQEG